MSQTSRGEHARAASRTKSSLRLAKAGPTQILPDLAAAIRVAPLEPCVQEDVGQQAATEAIARGHQAAHLGRRDALERAAQPRVEAHALQRLQQQGVEVEHAELAVTGPRLAFA